MNAACRRGFGARVPSAPSVAHLQAPLARTKFTHLEAQEGAGSVDLLCVRRTTAHRGARRPDKGTPCASTGRKGTGLQPQSAGPPKVEGRPPTSVRDPA